MKKKSIKRFLMNGILTPKGKKIFNEKIYKELVELRKTEEINLLNAEAASIENVYASSDYFPEYRAEFIIENGRADMLEM